MARRSNGQRIRKNIVVICEGENTEPKYLEDLAKSNPACMLQILPYRYTGAIEIAKAMIREVKKRKPDKQIEYWCVFDWDVKNFATKEAYRLIFESNAVSGRPQIEIAFCKPCFEFWVLLHFVDKPSDIKPLTVENCQIMLKKYMKYSHSKGAVVAVEKMMPGYDRAFRAAQALSVNYPKDKQYEAPKFAGIFRLTEKILNA